MIRGFHMPVRDVNWEEVLGSLHLTLWARKGPWVDVGVGKEDRASQSGPGKRHLKEAEPDIRRGWLDRPCLLHVCGLLATSGLSGDLLHMDSYKVGASVLVHIQPQKASEGLNSTLAITKSSDQLSIAELKATPKLRGLKQLCYLPMILCIKKWKVAPRANSW